MHKMSSIILSCIILPFVMLSCSTILELAAGDAFTTTTRRTLKKTLELVDSTGKRSVVLVPMVHVGKAKDYERIRQYLNKLKANGYVTFFEGLVYTSASLERSYPVPVTYFTVWSDSVKSVDNSEILDTLSRKVRRGYGSDPFTLINSHAKYGKISQSRSILGLTTSNDYWTDMSMADLVWQHENRYSKIVLSEYDWNVPLDDPKYNSRKAGGRIYRFVNTIRDEHLLSLILSSDFDKIAVVYGAAHTNQVKFHLIYDHHFKKVKCK